MGGPWEQTMASLTGVMSDPNSGQASVKRLGTQTGSLRGSSSELKSGTPWGNW